MCFAVRNAANTSYVQLQKSGSKVGLTQRDSSSSGERQKPIVCKEPTRADELNPMMASVIILSLLGFWQKLQAAVYNME